MRYAIVLLLSVCALSAHALDTTIRVLAVNVNGNSAAVTSNLNYLTANWPGSGNVTVTLANNGNPVSMALTPTSGNPLTVLTAARTALIANGLRETHSADVVLVFVNGILSSGGNTYCGYAQTHWIDPAPNTFVPTGGLDLRGKDGNNSNAGWAAIVTTDANNGCIGYSEIALHELGHLLGAGHYEPLNAWLHNYSHAESEYISIPFPVGVDIYLRTIMANPGNSICGAAAGCMLTNVFSDGNPVSTRHNLNTLAVTALSVANYRTAQGGGCNLTRPNNLVGSLIQVCAPSPWTRHFLAWNDDCPAETDFFQLFVSQPVGQPYLYGWTAVIQSSDVYVYGANANIKVRACNAGGCSPLSTQTYLATSQCSQ